MTTPVNQNRLHPNKFLLVFNRLPTVQYFCQTASLPGISMGEAPRPTPFIDLYAPGDKMIYDYFTVTFMVDEDLNNWFEIHDWIRGMTFPVSFDEYKNLGKLDVATSRLKKDKPQYSDAALTALDVNENPRHRFKFLNCFPTTLSAIIFSTLDSPETVMTADVSFRFDLFDRVKLDTAT